MARSLRAAKSNAVQRRWKKYDDTIESGLNILGHLGLNHKQQGRVLGYHVVWPGDLVSISEHLKSQRNYDVERRLNLLILILTRAEALFGSHQKSVAKWFRTRLDTLDKRSPRSTISSGEMQDMVLVDSYLARMTG